MLTLNGDAYCYGHLKLIRLLTQREIEELEAELEDQYAELEAFESALESFEIEKKHH